MFPVLSTFPAGWQDTTVLHLSSRQTFITLTPSQPPPVCVLQILIKYQHLWLAPNQVLTVKQDGIHIKMCAWLAYMMFLTSNSHHRAMFAVND